MLLDEPHGLAAVGGFQDGGLVVQFGKRPAHRFPDQLVIIDDQDEELELTRTDYASPIPERRIPGSLRRT